MDALLKWAIGGAATITGGFLLRKVYTLKDLSGNLIIETQFPKIYRLQVFPPELILSCGVTLKNDSRGTIRVKHPMVSVYETEKAMRDNDALVSSTPEDRDYTIPKSGFVNIDNIMLPVPILTAAKLVAKAWAAKGLNLWVRKGTIIGNALPYRKESMETFEL